MEEMRNLRFLVPPRKTWRKCKMERDTILILNADTDMRENQHHNLANYIHGLIFNEKQFSDRFSLVTYNVHQGHFPDEEENFAAAIITGSSTTSIVENLETEEEFEWVTGLIEYTDTLIERQTPILGVCFGSQILAHSIGGEVGNVGTHEDGQVMYELGYKEIELNENGQNSELFKNFPSEIYPNQSHRNVVTSLPDEAVLLGKNDVGIQVYQFNNSFGIQFHPEIFLPQAKGMLECKIQNHENVKQFEEARRNIDAEYELTNNNDISRIFQNFLNYISKRNQISYNEIMDNITQLRKNYDELFLTYDHSGQRIQITVFGEEPHMEKVSAGEYTTSCDNQVYHFRGNISEEDYDDFFNRVLHFSNVQTQGPLGLPKNLPLYIIKSKIHNKE